MKLCLQCNNHYEDNIGSCPNDPSSELVDVGNDPVLGMTVSNRYKILHNIGKGSMGVVYRAIQLSTGREMAVKFLKTGTSPTADEALTKRFQREAKTLSSLKHPNIVTLFDFGFTEANEPYIVTEFLHGLTLTTILREHGHLNLRKTMAIFKQVFDAVAEAHKHKIVHRDIKPDNILLQGKDSGGRFVKVLDFGIAKLLNDPGMSALTMEGRVCGSPAYMSPEQCKGIDVDYRCDIYALCAVMFESLTGRRLFPGDDPMSVMFAHVNEAPPRLQAIRPDPEFSQELELVFRKALSKEPKRRHHSVEELWEDLVGACAPRPKKQSQPGWKPIPAASTSSLRERAEQELLASGIDWEMLQAKDSSSNVVYLHEFRRKRRNLFIKLGALILAVSGSFFFLDRHNEKLAVETADLLITNGRPEAAVWFLERIKSQHPLSTDDAERLNDAYLKSAIKYAKRRNYSQAVNQLQHIPARSKYGEQAATLLRRYKRRS